MSNRPRDIARVTKPFVRPLPEQARASGYVLIDDDLHCTVENFLKELADAPRSLGGAPRRAGNDSQPRCSETVLNWRRVGCFPIQRKLKGEMVPGASGGKEFWPLVSEADSVREGLLAIAKGERKFPGVGLCFSTV